MRRFVKHRSKKAGLPPGTLVHIGEKKAEKAKITVIDYDEKHFEEKEIGGVEECFLFKETPTITWINVDGIHELDSIEKLGAHFGMHPLILEDIVNTGQRPKLEDLEDYFYIVLKMLYYNDKKGQLEDEQVSVILGPNFVISFQEREGDVFNSVRDRIRNAKGRVRKMGSDYLAYTLLDSIVDSYFNIMERLGEEIEALEEELVKRPSPGTLHAINRLKREMLVLRRTIWPLREVISGIERSGSRLVKKSSHIYFKDVYDHTIQVIDNIETFRDMLSGMLDIYLSSLSNRMNEVMKVLTVIATIFIPLTFITGIYGMNFRYMPELEHGLGYPVVIALMAAIAIAMAAYFKKKKWF